MPTAHKAQGTPTTGNRIILYRLVGLGCLSPPGLAPAAVYAILRIIKIGPNAKEALLIWNR